MKLYSLFLLILFTPPLLATFQDFIELGEKLFFGSRESMTWKDSVKFCNSQANNERFYVTKLDSAQENNLAKTALNLKNKIAKQSEDAWLGGYLVDNKWVWGDTSPFTYTNWDSGQPSSNKNLRCLSMKKGTGKWFSDDCSKLKPVLCQGYSYTKMVDYTQTTTKLTKEAAAKECELLNGKLSSIFSSSENDLVASHTKRGIPKTPSPTRRPTTKPPTKPPTFKPKPKQPTPKPACCQVFCDAPNCPSNCCPPTKKPTRASFTTRPTRRPTFEFIPRRRILQMIDDDDDEFLIFLGANNEKVLLDSREFQSYVWDTSGISFKKIGFLPANESNPFSNWALNHPLKVTNSSCVAIRGSDGKWKSVPCDSKKNAFLCQFNVVEKTYKLFLKESLTLSESIDFCASTGGQLVSIKTPEEFIQVYNQAKSTPCTNPSKPCSKSFWTSGKRQPNDIKSFSWLDGLVFYRDGIPYGYPTDYFGNADSIGSDCVAVGDVLFKWFHQKCSLRNKPMCEYRVITKSPTPKPKQQGLRILQSSGNNNNCNKVCLPSWIGDGECDERCRLPGCSFDKDDCGRCNKNCPFTRLNNGRCDDACLVESCGFDHYDCPVSKLPKDTCGANCKIGFLSDSICDPFVCGVDCDKNDCYSIDATESQCNFNCNAQDRQNNVCDTACIGQACGFDNGQCPICNLKNCPNSVFSNTERDTCEVGCKDPMCRYDLNRCDINQLCAPNCFTNLLGNSVCNPACNNKNCKFDAGDCPSRPVCLLGELSEFCQPGCNNPLFKFQGGVCKPNSCLTNGCTVSILGNGICDPACNKPECGMDGGDCQPCSDSCSFWELNNGVCSGPGTPCNTPQCGFDGGDCITSTKSPTRKPKSKSG